MALWVRCVAGLGIPPFSAGSIALPAPQGRAVFSHIPALVVLSLKNYLSNNPDSNTAAAATARIIVSVNE